MVETSHPVTFVGVSGPISSMKGERTTLHWTGLGGRMLKLLAVAAALVAAAFFGMHWIRDNPHTVDIQKIQQQPYQLPGPQDPYPK
jgi:hypothetical protein